MPKLEKRVNDYLEGRLGTEDLQEDEKWCIYMKYHHERLTSPLVEELCRQEEGIMHAEKTLTKVSRDYQRFARNLALDKNWLDLMYAKERSRKQGLEEGLEQGIEKGLEQGRKEKLEIARRLKLLGIPIEQIAEGTGLSIDEIAKL
jgi:predicted transposase/invertase (TIGR01784 family)